MVTSLAGVVPREVSVRPHTDWLLFFPVYKSKFYTDDPRTIICTVCIYILYFLIFVRSTGAMLVIYNCIIFLDMA